MLYGVSPALEQLGSQLSPASQAALGWALSPEGDVAARVSVGEDGMAGEEEKDLAP